MQLENSYQQLKAATTKEVVNKAKQIAKAKRMTFQGWLAEIIEHEVEAYEKREVCN